VLQICIGSAIQIALVAAPVLVIATLLSGRTMALSSQIRPTSSQLRARS
jgi:Ca2+/H+ antiporter